MSSCLIKAPCEEYALEKLEKKGLVKILIRHNPRVTVTIEKDIYEYLNEKIGEALEKQFKKTTKNRLQPGEYSLLISKKGHSITEETRQQRGRALKEYKENQT